MDVYEYRNCQLLFGYAAKIHERSGGVCQLCGCGAERLDFDLWRQMTVEHLIGRSQGGYIEQIRSALDRRFPSLTAAERDDLARQIDAANTVTACSFCNSSTSRDRAEIGMAEAIDRASDGSTKAIYESVTRDLAAVLGQKQQTVRWKLASVRAAFDELVAPKLEAART